MFLKEKRKILCNNYRVLSLVKSEAAMVSLAEKSHRGELR
jgi:hypothetical protein